ncbi:hypothetical protein TNCT_678791 [Trichonephila clavata]|uniref:Uncharacterized protein n=1 Tax=Trichonephila clavata TaxID=2740835 RepID=A0A8X6L498_TRICU|nr:hypothetical protein TNCT_678791 [Trichonephila clavata]
MYNYNSEPGDIFLYLSNRGDLNCRVVMETLDLLLNLFPGSLESFAAVLIFNTSKRIGEYLSVKRLSTTQPLVRFTCLRKKSFRSTTMKKKTRVLPVQILGSAIWTPIRKTRVPLLKLHLHPETLLLLKEVGTNMA